MQIGRRIYMSTIVVYQSKTGFTKQYAEWIAKSLSCEAKPIKQMKKEELSDYDLVIFGGWIMGNHISGLEKMRKMKPKQLVVFATGATNPGPEIEQTVREANQLGEQPFFYMQGGFRYERLSAFKKMMLQMVKKMIAKQEEKTEQTLFMERVIGTSFDQSDKKYTEGLIAYALNQN